MEGKMCDVETLVTTTRQVMQSEYTHGWLPWGSVHMWLIIRVCTSSTTQLHNTRAANEPLPKFSQSRRRPLLDHKAWVGWLA